jgi:Fe-S oxidoreductase
MTDNEAIVVVSNEDIKKKLTRDVATAIETCVRCGLCADSCHYYLGKPAPENIPAFKGEAFRRSYKKFGETVLSGSNGANKRLKISPDALSELAFSSCTLCRRCVMSCPMGVDTALLMKVARGLATASGKAPEILTQLADTAIDRGENLDLFRETLIENIKGLEDEVCQRSGHPEFSIPVEKKGADILFVALSGAHSIIPPAILFNYAKANWTLSLFEASNYGVFLGDTERAKRIAKRIIDEAKRLEVKDVVIGECGHAYNTLRWEAPKWFGSEFPFRVRSIIEVLAEWILEGRLVLDSSANPESVTYHDSCNLTRNAGLLEEPRFVLKAAVEDFREMYPNKEENYCCGGGGGIVAVSEWDNKRLEAGRPKADQIRATGARIVVAACDNCRIQLGELNTHYNLGISVSGLADIVVNAVIKAAKPGQENSPTESSFAASPK